MKGFLSFSMSLAATLLAGCLLPPRSVDDYLNQESTKYVITQEDAHLLDGPYRILEKPAAGELVVAKNSVRYKINLRGCKTLGGLFDVHVKHSFYNDMDVYLLKAGTVNVSSNELAALVYRPANRIYQGGERGFENLTYVIPQLLHIAYGELAVDHSDTNHPLYQAFCHAERMAQQHRKGYWGSTSASDGELP